MPLVTRHHEGEGVLEDWSRGAGTDIQELPDADGDGTTDVDVTR